MTMNKFVLVFAISAPLLSSSAYAQEFAKSPSDHSNLSAKLSLTAGSNDKKPSPLGDIDTDIKVVEVTGYGESIDSARKDAVRLAVQRVAGVYIDTSRQVNEKITDKNISTVIEEKVLSYTSAYVDHLDVITVDQKDGLFTVHASVAVNARPLIRTLKDNSIPAASFDAKSAASVAESIAQEKSNAAIIYKNLISNMSHLYDVGIGKPALDAGIPTPTDEVWLKVPVTFFVNNDVIKEWRKKMDLIAQKRVSIVFPVSKRDTLSGQQCQIPGMDWQMLTMSVMHKVEDPDEVDGMRFKQICFSNSGSSGDQQAECLLRSFPVEKSDVGCEDRKSCPTIADSIKKPTLMINLMDQSGSKLLGYGIKLEDYPYINVFASNAKPENARSTSFMNFCGGHVDIPYIHHVRYGRETLFVPFPGSHIETFVYVKVPSEKVGSISTIQASIQQ